MENKDKKDVYYREACGKPLKPIYLCTNYLKDNHDIDLENKYKNWK